jgi:biopolymer transport protein ExbD
MQKLTTDVPQSATSDVDLTPMLDVVFIMLIFFIVSASFLKETGLDINWSDSDPRPTPELQNILITLDSSSQVWIDGRTIDPEAVRANIEHLRIQNPEASVAVQADRQSSIKALVSVMDASREAGIYDVFLATDET